MTRPDQKLSERRTLDAVLAVLGLRPDQEPEAGETPDFIVLVSGRTVGVEITTYQSGATVDGGTERRKVESEWDILQRASETFRGEHPELRNINVGLMFTGTVPPRRHHAEFMEEIAAFTHDHAADLTSQDGTYWPPSFSTPLMRAYLSTVYLRVDQHAVWHSNLAGGYVARPDSTIANIIAEKSAKRFRPTDELWLVIQSSTRISEMMSDIMGVAARSGEPVPGDLESPATPSLAADLRAAEKAAKIDRETEGRESTFRDRPDTGHAASKGGGHGLF